MNRIALKDEESPLETARFVYRIMAAGWMLERREEKWFLFSPHPLSKGQEIRRQAINLLMIERLLKRRGNRYYLRKGIK